ncbi:MupA/Atu3671 family FMN-dependent luciferase-like monooxygenase [Streptomyces sp. NPDC019396]|uniref:MupA/Atu3671 family FMN-dependent luciferase-like monooxygenase n=1 Tax=Streptomyces sp. NPDC019396 TaxID=3154687 RepID=UPI0033FD4D3E
MAEIRSARMSFAQERFWFLEQIAPEQAVYQVPAALRLRGALDEAALSRALTTVVARHEALRTRFTEAAGRTFQVVEDTAEVALERTESTEAELPAVLQTWAGRPFDLGRAPLLRALLVRLGAEDHALLLMAHHIIADGASMDIVLAELSAFYREEDLPAEPPLHYADYAMWQREQLSGPALEESLGFWRERLADLPELLELPADRTRPARQSYAGATHRFEFGDELTAAVTRFGAERGATPYMTMLAGFLAFVHRSTGRSDLVVGTPVDGRSDPQLERVVGAFTNTMAMRSEVTGGLTFGEIVDRVRADALACYPYADMPFEKLVDELQPSRQLSHSPIIQLMFAWYETGDRTLRIPGLDAEWLGLDYGSVTLDLILTVERHASGATGVLEYNTDLFDAGTIRRFAEQLTTLLSGAVAEPGTPIARLPMTTEADADAVRRLNDTARDYPNRELVHERIAEQARRTPEATALISGDTRLSYAELNSRANRLARRLIGRGAGPEQLVAVAMRRTEDLPVALLAVLKTGAGYVPVDPDYPERRRRQMLADSGASLVLTGTELLDGDGAHPLDGDAAGPLDAAGAEPDVSSAVRPENPAYVIYTSGSTGTPKGVTVPHGALTNFLHAMDEHITAAEGSVWLATTSISFDIAGLELLWTLARGVTVVLQGEERSAPRPAVDFSLFYFASAEGDQGHEPYRLLLEGAKYADEHGFAGVWTPERHFNPFGGLYPNPSVTGAAVAAVTRRIAVRAGSVVLPLQDPLRVAEEWAVVDGLSGGRAEVSFASGWLADDFVLAPGRHADRKRVLLEGMDTVRALWRGEAVERDNGAGATIEVRTHPRPARGGLPVWLTSSGDPATFEEAGRAGVHLLTHLLGQSLEELGEKVARYRRAWDEAGHPGRGRVALMVHTAVDGDAEAVRERARKPFVGYLRSSLGLVKRLLSDQDAADLEALPPEELDVLLERYYDRFASEAGLFGSPETCEPMVGRIAAAGVDEIACLIDFGIDPEQVLASLPHLDDLRARWARSAAQAGPQEDHSVLAQLARHGATHLQCTPSLALALAETDAGLATLEKLEQLVIGGEAFPAALAGRLSETLRGRVLNMYGPTETTVWSSAQPVTGDGPPPIGRPVANTRFHLVGQDGEPVPVGTPGELLIGGDSVARGYWGRPALTAERFVPDPYGPPGARLYRTGDLAVLRPDGTLEYRGRIDDQVKLRGRRIELGEIEAHIEAFPAVDRAITGVVGEGDRAALAAWIRPRGAALTAAEAGDPELIPLPTGGVVATGDRRAAAEIHKEIFEDGDYLGDGFLRLWDGMTVLDAGANVGGTTLWAHRSCRPARILSVEPIPPTFDRLSRTVRANGIDAVLVNAGLADTPGTAEFTYYPALTGLSGRYADPVADRRRAAVLMPSADSEDVDAFLAEQYRSERFTCRLTTLHELIAEHGLADIGLLKVDVERAELDVLAGLDDADWPRVRQVAVEVEGDVRRDEVLAELERHGFETASRTILSELEVGIVYGRRPDMTGAELPVATPAEAPPDLDRLREHLRRSLPAYMVPEHLTLLTAFPTTPNGKVDRKALAAAPAQPDAAAGRTAAPVAPRSALERRLAEVWCSVLGVERIGIHENFFDAGGNSLLLIRVHARLAELVGTGTGTAPRLVDLFAYPTIAALAAHMGDRQSADASGTGAKHTTGQDATDTTGRRTARNRFHRRRKAGTDG